MPGPTTYGAYCPSGSVTSTLTSKSVSAFVPGQQLYLSYYYNSTRVTGSATDVINAAVQWYNSVGTLIGTTSINSNVNGTSSGWIFGESSHFAPATAVTGTVVFTITPGSGTTQHNIYISKIRLGRTQVGADVTSQMTALGDGNRVRFSLMERGSAGYVANNPNALVGTGPVLNTTLVPGYSYQAHNRTWTAAGQSFTTFTDNSATFRIPVRPNERLWASARVAADLSGGTGQTWALWISFLDSAGAAIGGAGDVQLAGSGTNPGGNVVGNFVTAHPSAFSAILQLSVYRNSSASTFATSYLAEPMVCSAGVNQTAQPTFNPGPSSELAADVTANVVGPAASDVLYDNAGTTFQSADDLNYKVQNASGTITTGVTMTYKVTDGTFNGLTAASGSQTLTISSGGASITPTSITTATATLQITATVNGRQLPSFTTKITKVNAPAAPTGTGGGGGGATDVPSQTSGFTPLNSSSYTTITQSLTFTLPTGKTTLRCIVNLANKYPKLTNSTGPWDVQFKIQRGGVDQGTAQNSDPDAYTGADPETGATVAIQGTMQYTLDMTGLTAGTQYTVIVQARVASGALSTNGYSMSFTGSVALSAP